MPIWLVRANQNAGDVDGIIRTARLVIEEPQLDNLRSYDDKLALRNAMTADGVDESELRDRSDGVWRFFQKLQRNESVLLPIDDGAHFLLGQIESDYHYLGEAEPQHRHARQVFWRRTALEAAELPAGVRDLMERGKPLANLCPVELENQIYELFEAKTQTGFVKDGMAPEEVKV
jgi:predicted Mrr-cat superfamily restriction endonuclease